MTAVLRDLQPGADPAGQRGGEQQQICLKNPRTLWNKLRVIIGSNRPSPPSPPVSSYSSTGYLLSISLSLAFPFAAAGHSVAKMHADSYES